MKAAGNRSKRKRKPLLRLKLLRTMSSLLKRVHSTRDSPPTLLKQLTPPQLKRKPPKLRVKLRRLILPNLKLSRETTLISTTPSRMLLTKTLNLRLLKVTPPPIKRSV